MKKLLRIFTAITILVFLNSCATQNAISSPEIKALLDNGEFTFMAQRANPMDNDVIRAMNSLSNSGSSRILNLDYGDVIAIKKETIEVALPYFGRMYSANLDPQKNSFRFSSKDFTVNRQETKKGNLIFTIAVNDQQNIRKITMEIFKNGKSYVTIDANDRQPISYDGYIMKNTEVKK